MDDSSILRNRPILPDGPAPSLAERAAARGRIDILTAGYPCQPFSTAARGRNNAVDMWPDTFRIIRCVRPRWVILENVPGSGLEHIERSCCDLESIGYAVWPLDIACEIRNHVRQRCWVVAHANGYCEPQCAVDEEVAFLQTAARRWRDQSEPMGVDDGLPGKMDRLKSLGNAIEPVIAEIIMRAIRAIDSDKQIP